MKAIKWVKTNAKRNGRILMMGIGDKVYGSPKPWLRVRADMNASKNRDMEHVTGTCRNRFKQLCVT